MEIKLYIINSSLKSHEEFGKSIFAEYSVTYLFRVFFLINKFDGFKLKKNDLHNIVYLIPKKKAAKCHPNVWLSIITTFYL